MNIDQLAKNISPKRVYRLAEAARLVSTVMPAYHFHALVKAKFKAEKNHSHGVCRDLTGAELLVDYAEMVLTNASNLWKAAPSEQKQRLQQVLFPEGVTYSEGKYRTAVTCLLFNGMGTVGVNKERLVALPGIEPGF